MMKNWKFILIGGFLVFILVKVFVINPLMEKSKDISGTRTISAREDAAGEVTMTDQNGRPVSMNEIMQWKPEVVLE